MGNRICTFLGIVFFSLDLCIFHSDVGSKVVFQKCQVMATSLVYCFRYSWYNWGAPQCLDYWSSCDLRGKMGEGDMESDKSMVMEDECVVFIQNLDGRLVLIFIRVGDFGLYQMNF